MAKSNATSPNTIRKISVYALRLGIVLSVLAGNSVAGASGVAANSATIMASGDTSGAALGVGARWAQMSTSTLRSAVAVLTPDRAGPDNHNTFGGVRG